ncbi:hypothetical protein [Klenkia sp. PcliD-1-E]|uniref:hypothetical protein n=1 Tax=Klenkia sp. PcliD-1-E TaxID=2954492 RepID=UPI002096E433|nr:hypothetical protein [Klenkia sp. PcliD-1-E]MCO7222279.1 hypothetical protein [Klenkia sp. PcliD-1-E]
MTPPRAVRFAVPLLAAVAVAGCSSSNVSCSGNSCTATIEGEGAEASVLGTSVVLGGVQDGRATLSVGDAQVSCATGESVSAGPLSLTCTSVEEGRVELTASLG